MVLFPSFFLEAAIQTGKFWYFHEYERALSVDLKKRYKSLELDYGGLSTMFLESYLPQLSLQKRLSLTLIILQFSCSCLNHVSLFNKHCSTYGRKTTEYRGCIQGSEED